MRHPAATRAALISAALAIFTGTAPVSAQPMPDARQMSGVPLPVGDLTPGTVTVRVIRGSLANPVTRQPVALIAGGTEQTVPTNEAGRAAFSGLRPGTRVKVRTTVDGQTLESQEFDVPASGGVRLMLVATDPAAGRGVEQDSGRAGAAGGLILGEQSRFVLELGEDGLSVFNLLQIVNTGTAPVQPAGPIVFELPVDARDATILQGSSPQASAAGRRVEVKGPFPPGATLVQAAYTVPYSGPDARIEQTLPLPSAGVMLIAQKVDGMTLHSPQVPQHREMPANGQTYIVGRGPAVTAGGAISFSLSGLPYHPRWPRNLALALATLILAGGAWTSLKYRGAGISEGGRRPKLESRRERLFAELTALEGQRHDQTIDDERYAERRRELVTALERIYAELDEEGQGVTREPVTRAS